MAAAARCKTINVISQAQTATNVLFEGQLQIFRFWVRKTYFKPTRCQRSTGATSYLLLLGALQVPPLLRYVAEVHLVHGHLDVADGVVFGEAVEVVHRHHQRLSTQLHVGDLWQRTGCMMLRKNRCYDKDDG